MVERVVLEVNGTSHSLALDDPDMPLLYALRDEIGLNNPHFGCGLAQCGACTVHVDGAATRSCVTPVSAVQGAKVTTLAGLGTPEHPHPLQTGLHRRAGAAMRLLHQWLDDDGGGAAQGQPASERCRDPRRPLRSQMPLRHPSGDPARRQARGAGELREASAMTQMPISTITRRSVLKAAGALMVTVAASGEFQAALAQAGAGAATKPPLSPDQLDSWIAVERDGSVTAFFGKMDMGQGVDVAIGQIVAEELDVPFARVTVVMGDTAVTVNQGGASGSTGIWKGGVPLRNAAAEARRLLVEMAAKHLGVAPDQLGVSDGVVAVTGQPAKSVSYAELIGGRYFDAPMTWNGTIGNDLVASGKAKPKSPDLYKVVGQPIPRADVAAQGLCAARLRHRHEGAGHGAWPHDPAARRRRRAGRGGRGVDPRHSRRPCRVEAGFPRRRRRQGMERDPRRRAAQGDLVRDQAALPGSEHALRPHPQGAGDARARSRRRTALSRRRSPAPRDASRPNTNGRSSRMPAWARPAPSPMSATARRPCGPARRSRISPATASPRCSACRPIRCTRSGSRDQAPTAATMRATPRSTPRCCRRRTGRPVRVQGMRHDGHGWDPKGPASVHRARAGIDAAGNVVAYHFESKGFSRFNIAPTESQSERQPRRAAHRPAARLARRLRRAAGRLCLRSQAAGVGDDPAAARPGIAAAHRASARSRRAADPFRQRVLHRRARRRDRQRRRRVPPAPPQGRRATSPR